MGVLVLSMLSCEQDVLQSESINFMNKEMMTSTTLAHASKQPSEIFRFESGDCDLLQIEVVKLHYGYFVEIINPDNCIAGNIKINGKFLPTAVNLVDNKVYYLSKSDTYEICADFSCGDTCCQEITLE